MKKIEFRTKDGYQYTITEMDYHEMKSAALIFCEQGGRCYGLKPWCQDCPLEKTCYKDEGYGNETNFHNSSKKKIIKSSIKITY